MVPVTTSPWYSAASGVSADGSAISMWTDGPPAEAFRWTQATGPVGLGALPGPWFESYSNAISADGSVVAGVSYSNLGYQAFRWTQATGMVGLGELSVGATNSAAYGISADGTTIVGQADSSSGPQAFYWTQATGMVGLGDLSAGTTNSYARATSANGSVIVGWGQSTSGNDEAFRWTQATGMVGLGFLSGGSESEAWSVSGDGSIIVGSGITLSGRDAFIYDSSYGMRNLQSVLTNEYGLNLTGWQLTYALSISSNGQAIVGEGIDPSGNQEAWLASIPGFSTLALSANSITLRAMRNSGTTGSVTLSETSGINSAGFNSSLGGAATISPSAGTLAASGTQSLNLGWSDYTTTGPRIGTVTLSNSSNSADPFNSAGNVISMSGAVVDNRVVTASTTNFGLVHVGAAVSQPITLSTSGDDNHFTRVSVGNAGPDANGISVIGGTNPVFNSSSVTDQRTLGGIFSTVGTVNGSITLPTTGEGLSGETPINVPVSYTAQVYSGQAEWNYTTGLWETAAYWKDTVGGGPSKPPGLSGFVADTATFGPNAFSGIVVVALDTAAPVLTNLIFNNSNTSYWILQTGTSGLTLTSSDGNSPAAITVLSGTHFVDASILLENNLAVSDSGNLTVSGDLGDGGMAKSLTLDGGGELILSGNNSYTGGTVVSAGTLILDSSTAIGSGTSLIVGVNATSIFGASPAALLAASSPAVSPVPEPGALVLLGVGALVLLAYAWRHGKRRGLGIAAEAQ